MHSRGEFETMHSQQPVEDIQAEVSHGLSSAIAIAKSHGIGDDQVALDIGLGFGKTFEQNLGLLANLDKLVNEFSAYPVLVGASRKSFIGKLLDNAPPSERLGGSLAVAMAAMQRGARIIRVHDVRETVQAVRIFEAIERSK
jgi:dihydropteroate synthase